MSKRILFVDDEPMVLQGIERSLRSMRGEWETEFATSGSEALETMARGPFDVVISDMRMPGMDGAQLLDLVKAKFPRTVRMVLSGQSDHETVLRSIGPTHQYLSKPCDVEELKQKLARAFALRDLLDNPRLKEVVCRLENVPSLPSLYMAVNKALQSPDSAIAEVGNLIAQDMGMSMKLLQLVNSAFFGLSSQVSSPKQAAALVGIDNIRSLVLSVHVFSQFEGPLSEQFLFLWDHSVATAGFAKAIAREQHTDLPTVDNAFTAGLLHDVGKLVLACACGPEYLSALQRAGKENISMLMAEQDAFGCTHAGVGAYLLGLWGLPDAIVEAVAWHHTPSEAGLDAFSPLIAVHAGDYFDHQIHTYPVCGEKPALDEALLDKLKLKDHLENWSAACRHVNAKEESHA